MRVHVHDVGEVDHPGPLCEPALEAGLEEEMQAALEVDHAARVVERGGDLTVHEPANDAVQVVRRGEEKELTDRVGTTVWKPAPAFANRSDHDGILQSSPEAGR